MKRAFHIFKNNTDATSTNKGFYFQYLLTLETWIDNYSNTSFELYCEHEEDILAVDHSKDERQYIQAKCYSSTFSLDSEEVITSILNFYKLHQLHKKGHLDTYTFCTTAGIKPRSGKALQKWYKKQMALDFEIEEFVLPVKTAIFKYLNKLESKYSNGIDIIQKSTVQRKIQDFKSKINSENFELFLQRIRWKFDEYTDDNFEKKVYQIERKLDAVNYNHNIKGHVFVSYLLHHILKASSSKDVKDRALNFQLFEKLVNDTKNENKIYSVLDKELAMIFELLPEVDKRTARIEEKADRIIDKIEKLSPVANRLELLYGELMDWFIAISYTIGNINIKKADSFLFDVLLKERRKSVKVLIYGVAKTIEVPDLQYLEKLIQEYECDEVWVVTTSYPSPAVRAKLEKEASQKIFCYNFDELIEETIDFSNYFDWVEQEVLSKKINKRFIPVGVKKGEFQPETKEIVATSTYREKEGWLEGYINSWLADQIKEHVSILGEFGTGKTWFALYYTWQQIKEYKIAKIKRLPRPRIPILIFLRDFAKAMQVDVLISDFFFRKHQIDIKGVFNAFDRLNKMGKLLLVFDGFDEMADRIDKQKMIDNFWQLATMVKGRSKVILTCRNEHFATINEGRHLFNSEYRNATSTISNEFPKFDIVELLKFDKDQIKKLLSHFTGEKTISLLLKNEKIVDLLSRPIMIELVIDAIKDIEHSNELDEAKIYFYATRRKMERDIAQQRTFTTLADKFFFMCELSWEMLSNDKLTIHYKEFPNIIYQHFNISIDEKDLDYWRYDLRGQSILIIDDEGGNYKPAHKSMLEFFVAYKFASDLGLLKEEYTLDGYGKKIAVDQDGKCLEDLLKTMNNFNFLSNKLRVVFSFLKDLINFDLPFLWSLYEDASVKKDENNIFLSNILTLITRKERVFSGRNFSGIELYNVDFSDSDLRNTDFSNSVFHNGGLYNCDLDGSNFENVKMTFSHGYPVMRDICGDNVCDFTKDNEIVHVGRSGLSRIRNGISEAIPISMDYVFKLKTIPNSSLICCLTYVGVFVVDLTDCTARKITNYYHNHFGEGISVNATGDRFAIVTDRYGEMGEIFIWDTHSLKENKISLKNSGLFTSCFLNDNQIITGGRDGIISWIDTIEKSIIKTLKLQDIPVKSKFREEPFSPGYVYSISVNKDQKLMAIASTLRCLIIWDLQHSLVAVEYKLLKNDYCTLAVFSPDGKYLAFSTVFEGVKILTTQNWQSVYSTKKSVVSLRFSSDSKYLTFGSRDDEEIFVLEILSMKILSQYTLMLSFKELSIKKMIAPFPIISYFLKRGAYGWYKKPELAGLLTEELNILALQDEEEVEEREKTIEKIWQGVTPKDEIL